MRAPIARPIAGRFPDLRRLSHPSALLREGTLRRALFGQSSASHDQFQVLRCLAPGTSLVAYHGASIFQALSARRARCNRARADSSPEACFERIQSIGCPRREACRQDRHALGSVLIGEGQGYPASGRTDQTREDDERSGFLRSFRFRCCSGKEGPPHR